MTKFLESPDGSKRFVMQEDGNAVIYDKRNAPLWSFGGSNAKDDYNLTLDAYGVICIHNTQRRDPKCASGPLGERSSDSWTLELQNNGYLYLKDSGDVIRWVNLCPFSGDSIDSGKSLVTACIPSPDFSTFMYMQPDGNLVIYRGYTPLLVFSQLLGRRTAYLEFSNTGSLKIKDENKETKEVKEYFLFNGVGPGTYRAAVNNDGRIVIKGGDGNERWTNFPNPETPER